jgi:drug/metabolite transporter (DMT)-like permease
MASIILGVLILITKGSLQSLFQIQFSMGDLLMLIACLFFASYTILVKPKEQNSIQYFVLGVLFLFHSTFGTPLL